MAAAVKRAGGPTIGPSAGPDVRTSAAVRITNVDGLKGTTPMKHHIPLLCAICLIASSVHAQSLRHPEFNHLFCSASITCLFGAGLSTPAETPDCRSPLIPIHLEWRKASLRTRSATPKFLASLRIAEQERTSVFVSSLARVASSLLRLSDEVVQSASSLAQGTFRMFFKPC